MGNETFYCDGLSETLALILSISILSLKYPPNLKFSKIMLLFKVDYRADPNNYRPIALLSVLKRIFEKVMYIRLSKFIEENMLLFRSQYQWLPKTFFNSPCRLRYNQYHPNQY